MKVNVVCLFCLFAHTHINITGAKSIRRLLLAAAVVDDGKHDKCLSLRKLVCVIIKKRFEIKRMLTSRL